MPERLYQNIFIGKRCYKKSLFYIHRKVFNSLGLDKSWNGAAVETVICLNRKTLPKLFKTKKKPFTLASPYGICEYIKFLIVAFDSKICL